MTQPILVRTGTAPLNLPKAPAWPANGAAALPQVPVPQPHAAPSLGEDALRGLDGTRTIRETAQGPQPATPRHSVATPPKVEPPRAVFPAVSLTGSTQNRIDTLIGVQQTQFEAIATTLDGLGFKVDPKKTALGLTPPQQFFADLLGVLMGVEDGVKQTEAYKTLHQLYVSMPNQLSEQQLAELSGVVARLNSFPATVAAATELRVKINQAKADGNPQDAASWQSRLAVVERDQASGLAALADDLQRLNYRIDARKSSLGLSPSQQFYADLTGILVSADDALKETPEYRTLNELYQSMPSELTRQQLANLGGVTTRIKAFEESVTALNGYRVDRAKALADKDDGAVRRLDEQIARETERQQAGVREMVGELQRLNYRIDPRRIAVGLSPSQQFYAEVTGVLMGVEERVKETEAYKTLHQLYMSMPSQLSAQQLAELSGVMSRLVSFPETVKAITTLRGRINAAKEAGDQRMVDWWEGKIREVVEAQQRGVAALVSQLQGLNYRIDPSRIGSGLSPSQQFYADVMGILQGAEGDVKGSEAYKQFHALYLSMPSELSPQQLAGLAGISERMTAFAETVTTINALRVEISRARAAKDDASVARYERQIADLTNRQRGEMQAMVGGLEGRNFRVDPNKTSLGLSPTQHFYGELVGLLMGAEEVVKQTEAYKALHQIYASMPSQLSERQIADLGAVISRLRGLMQTVKAGAELRNRITWAKADADSPDLAWLESRLRVVEREQMSGVSALVSELRGLSYLIDERKISLGLTGSQAFYNDLSGILTMAEDPVKQSASYKRLAQLYASMPSELSEAQIRQLQGLWAQIRGVDPISDQITSLRIQLAAEKAEANRR